MKENYLYYLGLDLGSNSVGWAVTDEEYNIVRRKGKALWGIRLFEQADTAAERRIKRALRRRLERRKQRIDILQELFAEEMAKVDSTFYIRLNESRLHAEDKSENAGEKFLLFNDSDFTDKEYNMQYPTVFHLRKELIHSEEAQDIRLVYLAVHHIIKNRGHFLIDGNINNARSFKTTFEKLRQTVSDELDIEIRGELEEEFERILRNKRLAKSVKAKELTKLLEEDLKNYDKEEYKIKKSAAEQICKLVVGNSGDMKKLFPNKDIRYIYKVENMETTLMLDRSQIEQVLINLLKNASEACLEQTCPEVIVSTHGDPEKHLFFLSVCDNGSGILPEVLDKIFVPFFTTKPTGSGIGLSLCKQIMNLHGGSISASSEIGKGSCFTLKFLCCE